MRPIPEHPDVELIASDTVWQGRFPLERVRFRNRRFDGAMSDVRSWELWRRGPAAAMLPYDPASDSVVLIEQFRLPALAAGLDPMLIEISAGLCDGDEAPEDAIRREAVEEMALPPRRLHRVGAFILTAGGSDETCTLFVGEVAAPAAGPGGVIGTAGLASEAEDIRSRLWPAKDAVQAALDGRIANSVAAIALLWFGCRREMIRSLWSDA